MEFDIRQDEPVVSISLITYNHASYIRECLDSLLQQQTGFPYEICIGEDESVDGTREICMEYANRHPGRIRLFLRSQSEPGRSDFLSQGVYNYIQTTQACRGKYLALCDGDDAWIHPGKLQMQYDIMEADPGISLVHSDFEKVDEISGRRVHGTYLRTRLKHRIDPDKARFIFDVIQRNYPIAASTTFMRTQDVLEIFENNAELFRACPMGDTVTWCELSNYGTFHFQSETLGIYRILPESDSNSISAEKKFRFVNCASNLGLMVGEKYRLPMDRVRAFKVKNSNRYALLSGDLGEIRRLYEDGNYPFSWPETLIYQLNRFAPTRLVARELLKLRYRINHRLLNVPAISLRF